MLIHSYSPPQAFTMYTQTFITLYKVQKTLQNPIPSNKKIKIIAQVVL